MAATRTENRHSGESVREAGVWRGVQARAASLRLRLRGMLVATARGLIVNRLIGVTV